MSTSAPQTPLVDYISDIFDALSLLKKLFCQKNAE